MVGSFAGYFGGWADRVLMWVVDLLLVLPAFLIIAILSPQLPGRRWLLFVVLLALFSWMITARIVRGMTLSLGSGSTSRRPGTWACRRPTIIFRHILPNMSSLLIIDATLNVSAAILAETGLSFFGFGVQPPDISLGTLIADGRRSAINASRGCSCSRPGCLVLLVLASTSSATGCATPSTRLAAEVGPMTAAPAEAKVPPRAPPAAGARGPGPARTFPARPGPVHAVRGLSLRRSRRARSLGIVGESGPASR